jgi:hypothetical protein
MFELFLVSLAIGALQRLGLKAVEEIIQEAKK